MMNISLLLDMAADAFGDRVVVGPRADGLTARRLRQLAEARAADILAAGTDSVVYLDVNGPALPVALFAAARAGVPLVPLNYRLGSAQLESLLARHPKALGVAGDAQVGTLRAAGIDVVPVGEWISDSETTPTDAIAGPGDASLPAVLIYTSGTTSAPKGVVLRHASLMSYVLGTVEFAAADPDETALVSVPPYHIAAVANVLTNLYAGRRSLVLERFTPEEWLQAARAEGVTNAMVVPTMLARIVDCAADKDLPALRTIAYGGAPMPVSVIERALATWPGVGFVNAYGLTETSSTITVLDPEDHRAALASTDPGIRARLGSVGRAIPGVEIAILDSHGLPVPVGAAGRIHVRGEQVSAEYAGIGRVVDADGFFDTRDEGHLDAGGYLFIHGRADDTIIRGAENIAPAEIEDVLMRHPDVRDAVAVGVPDEEWGQRIEAAVVARPASSITKNELQAFVRSALRASKTPDDVIFLDELPRTDTGKIIRRDVVALLHAAGARGGAPGRNGAPGDGTERSAR